MSVNVPVTVWRKTDGLDENVFGGPYDIADPQGDHLVDTVGNQIVDTGIEMNVTPTTIWSENDSL